MKNIFIKGAISPEFIAISIAKHQSKKSIGAHNLFLGQVRADMLKGNTVKAIEFSSYQEMAEKEIGALREKAFEKFNLTCMHIHHSIGEVKVGEICIFVFVSAPHRKNVYKATEYIVEQVKTNVPLFGKELFDSNTHQWKQNK